MNFLCYIYILKYTYLVNTSFQAHMPKLLEQEGRAQSVISDFSLAIVECFLQKDISLSRSCFFLLRLWCYIQSLKRLVNFPQQPGILDPSLYMRRQMGVRNFPRHAGNLMRFSK